MPDALGFVVQTAPQGTHPDDHIAWIVASGYATAEAADHDVRQLARHRKKKGLVARTRAITAVWP